MSSSAGSFEEATAKALAAWGTSVLPEQLALFRQHFDAVLLANELMNLTRITDPQEAAIKHYADSLAILLWVRESESLPPCSPPCEGGRLRSGGSASEGGRLTLLDVGTGAGFPAVPIAVMRPAWRVTALDGTRKKAEFVDQVAAMLGLKNLKAEHGHSDHWSTGEKFDVVTTRAVASLARCMRTSRRLIGKGGRLIAYKTATLPHEETTEARQACGELGMEMEPPFLYELELNGEKMARALYPVRRVV